MKTIVFYDNNLCLRGTTNAMYDYADYNETILGNKSIVIAPPTGNLDALEKFRSRFKDNLYLQGFCGIDHFLQQKNADFIYIIKSGGKSDGLCTNNVPSLIHVVFCSNEPHGHRYCYVSDWLARSQGYDPVDRAVPHMITKLPESAYDFRSKYNISKNDIVLGCLAGSTEFNIKFVHNAVFNTAKERNDIKFVFLNINKFCDDSPNIIHLPGTWKMDEKAAFIRACDGMLHAREGGETFGCAVAEFSIENKPVITYENSGERSHIEILGQRGIFYKNYDDIYDIINNFKSYVKYEDYTLAYKNHSPEKIMNRFNKNFLC